MKLYELPRGSKFRILSGVAVPPGAPPVYEDVVYKLGNIDGMYSFCTNSNNEICHVLANADVAWIIEEVK